MIKDDIDGLSHNIITIRGSLSTRVLTGKTRPGKNDTPISLKAIA